MNTVTATLGPLLSPDELALTGTDRDSAHRKVDCALRLGGLSPQQAADRHELVSAARSRGELRQAFDGLADAVPPYGLTLGLRIATVGWLAVCVIQFVVWLTLAVFGHFDGPWWLWSDLGLGAAVAILWWTNESYHRKTQLKVL
jgi:hypothetical protein